MTSIDPAPGGRCPIVVLSFTRPDYLRPVLESLVAQQGCALAGRPVLLFQDGERNAFSGRRHGRAELIAQCVALFRALVPHGVVMASEGNLGVALNFERAERFVFEETGAAAAIFLEDDLVLSPHYIATLDGLLATHAADERVGYVAAYGDHRVALAEQRENPSRLTAMHHNWGFALTRRQWLRMRPRMADYLDLVRHVDYRQRDPEAIHQLYARWGFGRNPTSQDAAKTMACIATGAIKLKTRACLGRYIGERGLHMSPAVFEQRGFARTELFPDRVAEFEPLTDALYQRVMEELRRWAGQPASA